ncbi:MAG: hypothetical protein IJ283_02595 [Oscillospiraceae bacterium]|nr:hypothetical protein [Oscillospiraceae bacterium]
MKKLLCMVIALIMVLSMGVVAFAEENKATVSTTLNGAQLTVGEPFEFTVTTAKNNDSDVEDFNVVGVSTFSNPEAMEKLEYYDPYGDAWIDITNVESFGPEGGFSFADATSKFRVTFKTAGDYDFDFIIKSAYPVASYYVEVCKCEAAFSVKSNVIAPTFNPAPAEDPVIVDLDGADEAEEEANPNTGALVLVPAVVALAAVTGIMVSKRK